MSGWAIDLGTTNTGVARWDDDAERPRLVELPRVCRRPGGEDHLQAPRMVPSAVELAAPRGVWARMLAGQVLGRVFLGGDGALIGRMALERSEGERRPGFVPSFKRWLARDALHVLASAGGHSWTAREVAHAFLRQLLVEVRRETGERIRDLVLTTPVDTYESYRAELQGAARRLGVRRLRFLDEPVAAALGYDLGPRAARRVLVIDFGAGTLDVALVLLTPKGTLAGTCDVLAKDGRPLGGNDVDRWLLEDFCRRLDYPLREDDGSEEGRFWYRLMLDEARRVKEALFFAEEASFDLTPPEELRRFEAVVRGAGTELVVTREEVMALLVARGLDDALGGCLDGVLARAAEQGVPAEAIDDVLMVGGSTLLPGIYARIEARFGRDRVRAWKPFEAVAWGAATFAAGRFSQSDHIVQRSGRPHAAPGAGLRRQRGPLAHRDGAGSQDAARADEGGAGGAPLVRGWAGALSSGAAWARFGGALARENRDEEPCGSSVWGGQAAGDRRDRRGAAARGRGPGEASPRHGRVPHRRVHAERRRPRGAVPGDLRPRGRGRRRRRGPGVTSLKKGDHVIPLYTPECRQCKSCLSRKTNLCTAIRATQGKGRDARRHQPLLDRREEGSPLHGLQHLRELHRAAGDRAREDPRGRAVRQGLLHRLRRDHRHRRGDQHREGGAGRERRGLRARGHRPERVIQGARMVGANMIVGVDLNNDRKAIAEKFGMTHFVNPKEVGGDLVAHLVELTGGGADYSFECIGNVDVMRQALECTHRGWGTSVIIGVAGAGQEIKTRPFQLVTGRNWRGTAFGGARGRTDVPKIVDWYMDGRSTSTR
jgi:S-(hydroxymethyl)glutathione dehydrogenase/alcohol dehydrogenase